MNRVDTLKAASNAASVKFMEFMRAVSKCAKTIACIFEGEDEKYYSQRITVALHPLSWHGINTGGKKNALELFELIANHPLYKNSRYLCFVDKDFEDWWKNPNPDRIYCTPCYSIENFYVSESVFRRILSSEFQITEFNENRDEFSRCIDLYRKCKYEFLNIIAPFNKLIKAFRVMERDNKIGFSLNVRNIKIGKLVDVDFNGVTAIYDIKNPLALFKDASDLTVCADSFLEADSTLVNTDWESSFRGKQNAEFVRLLISKLKTDKTSENPSFFKTKGPVKLSLSKENFISDLSQYADTPDCLTKFLSNYKESLAV